MSFIKRMPIRNQLLILAASALLVVTLVLTVTYVMFVRTITNNNEKYMEEMFSQIRQNISSNADLFNRILTNIAYNNSIQEFMTTDDPVLKIDAYKHATNVLSNAQSLKKGIVDVILRSDNGNSLYLKGEKQATRAVIEQFEGRVINYYTGTRLLEYGSHNRCRCFVAALSVYSIGAAAAQGKKLGVAALVIDGATLGFYDMQQIGHSVAQYYLLDRDQTIYFSNDHARIGETFDLIGEIGSADAETRLIEVGGAKEWVKSQAIPEIGGAIVSIVPRQALLSELETALKRIVLLFAVSLLLLSVPYVVVIRNIIRPVNKFMTFMSEVKTDHLKALKKRIHVEGYKEMGAMSLKFNAMLDEIDSLTGRLIESNTRYYELKWLKQQSELAFLQSQINPHFLYNTLDAIRGIAAVKGVAEIRDLTGALSQIFKYSIKGEERVALREELAILASFLQIQLLRFAGRFEVTYEVEEAALDAPILRMILQPIVENAIYHGLEMKMDRGHLQIGARLDERTLRIWVADDGVGMAPEKLEALTQQLTWQEDRESPDLSPKTSIGLVNVNDRLKLTYGRDFGIRVGSVPGSGTRVELTLPGRSEQDVQSDDRRR